MNFVTDRIRGVFFGLTFAIIALVSPKSAFGALIEVVQKSSKIDEKVDKLSK